MKGYLLQTFGARFLYCIFCRAAKALSEGMKLPGMHDISQQK
ncbi:hypothetical protein [Lonsdalea iberica]|nr:hypothetical protein [Lonsdalea iberica]